MGRAGVALGAGCAASIGGALWIAAAAPVTGCYTHACDPSAVTYDGGEMVDDNTYETTPFVPDGGSWIWYPHNVTLTVNFPPSVGVGVNRDPVTIDAYVGTTGTPDEPIEAGGNFTTASGALIEYSYLNDAGFQVVNATCADYYARFVVHFPAVDQSAPGDAEVDASEAAPGDAEQ
ncbi:MAG: hypothetical protein WBY94_01305 [Polyangiaceae bacterium]